MLARSLWQAGFLHAAEQGFLSLATRSVSEELVGVVAASGECLVRARGRHPKLGSFAGQVRDLSSLEGLDPEMRARGAYYQAVEALSAEAQFATEDSEAASAAIKRTQALTDQRVLALAGMGDWLEVITGLRASIRGQHRVAIKSLEPALGRATLPVELERRRDELRLVLAGAAFSMERSDLAITELKKIPKNSNALVEALGKLSWAFLAAGRFSEAVGTGVNLQSGALRRVFAPEAVMVMSMALNEICQYPEALRAAGAFRRKYEPIYRWLESRTQGNAATITPSWCGFCQRGKE